MSLGRALLAWFAAASLSLSTSEALAQGEAKPLAEALFQHGRDLLAGRHVAEACAKFAMSQRVEPKLGTLLNLATCHETLGKTASAWAEFTEAAVQASRANQPEREQFATEHASALSPRLSRVAISAGGDQPLVVRLDGVELDRSVLSTPIPVDPGEHTVEGSSEGKTPWRTTLTIPPGPALTSIQVPVLAAEHGPVEAPSGEPSRVPPPPHRAPSYVWIPLEVSGIALAIGTIFGVRAIDKKRQAGPYCDGAECDPRGLDLYGQAQASGTISTVAFGVGVAALGVAVYMLVRPGKARSTAWLHAAPAPCGCGLSW
jgi:hypothetical protein